ncbi:MAG: 2Fe-2S iron-sulfur cluster binding domain-containing protein [Porticoccaceae bacterium]|nr:2Fe-2S iron-sulfur cluster binding domain-containing protein [Porticoccaceae bacterium]OUS08778.1 2Fe-2S ferredoxin [Gammaproteobacteria bacterium 54_18_T64]
MPTITFIKPDGETVAVEATNGATVMEVAKDHDMPMLAACGGSLACATCHVIVDEDWFAKSGELCEAEEDLLDTAHGLTSTSRLCCQMKVSDELNGMAMTLPPME